MNIVSAILNHARTRPAAPALAEIDRDIDYRQLALIVMRTAGHLHALGIGSGDRVGVCLKDTAANVIAFLSTAFIGAAAVPLDGRGRPEEIERITRALGLKRLLVETDSWLPRDSPA